MSSSMRTSEDALKMPILPVNVICGTSEAEGVVPHKCFSRVAACISFSAWAAVWVGLVRMSFGWEVAGAPFLVLGFQAAVAGGFATGLTYRPGAFFTCAAVAFVGATTVLAVSCVIGSGYSWLSNLSALVYCFGWLSLLYVRRLSHSVGTLPAHQDAPERQLINYCGSAAFTAGYLLCWVGIFLGLSRTHEGSLYSIGCTGGILFCVGGVVLFLSHPAMRYVANMTVLCLAVLGSLFTAVATSILVKERWSHRVVGWLITLLIVTNVMKAILLIGVNQKGKRVPRVEFKAAVWVSMAMVYAGYLLCYVEVFRVYSDALQDALPIMYTALIGLYFIVAGMAGLLTVAVNSDERLALRFRWVMVATFFAVNIALCIVMGMSSCVPESLGGVFAINLAMAPLGLVNKCSGRPQESDPSLSLQVVVQPAENCIPSSW